jgi:hypothetical protein
MFGKDITISESRKETNGKQHPKQIKDYLNHL